MSWRVNPEGPTLTRLLIRNETGAFWVMVQHPLRSACNELDVILLRGGGRGDTTSCYDSLSEEFRFP